MKASTARRIVTNDIRPYAKDAGIPATQAGILAYVRSILTADSYLPTGDAELDEAYRTVLAEA